MLTSATFGQRLRSARQDRGFSQVYLGGQVGLRSSVISQYEKDANRPGLTVAASLAAVLGVTLQELVCVDVRNLPRKHFSGGTFGQKLRQARESAGLFQEEIAAKFGGDQGEVSNYERDLVVPSVIRAAHLASAVGAWLDDLCPKDLPPRDAPAGRRLDAPASSPSPH